MWMTKTGERRVDDVERGGHGVGNGLDRGHVGVVNDKCPPVSDAHDSTISNKYCCCCCRKQHT